MKKYIKNIILCTLSITLLISCESELETFNNDPNSASTTTPSLLLAAMEVSTFSTHTSGLIRITNIFDQHLTGTNEGQMGEIARYVLNEQNINNEWNTVYGTTLFNGNKLTTQFENKYPFYAGIGQILTAINLGYTTDLWGDIPYDQAFKAEQGIKAPAYNTQKEIYQRLQAILDQAIDNLQKPASSNIAVPDEDDFIFKGETSNWIKIAYVLKARYALRLTNVDTNASQKALDYINASGISSNNDDANTYFTTDSNSQNQWYAFNVNRTNYIKMGAFFVNGLKVDTDPRLPFAVSTDKNGNYTGNSAEDQTTISSSYIGSHFASIDSPIGIVTFSEAKFIEAEAKFRLGQNAKPALKEAIAASVLKITGTAATNAFIENATIIVDLPAIIFQKYKALFLTMEPYNDYRRTGLPTLIPNQNSSTQTIPVRFPTPSDERNYNPNATVVSNVTTKVWWDKN